MAVRGREDGERVRAELEAEVPGASLAVDVLDVSSLADVRAYAAAFEGPLDVLVHNAGVMPAEREETEEGHERMLATHVLGPHLLTRLLRPAMPRGARVIWVASGGMYGQRLRADDLQYLRGDYKPDDRLRPHQARPGRAVGAVGAGAAPATGSSCTRCTPAGRTRPASPPRCPASAASPGRSCARTRRAPTRSSGSPPPPSPERSSGRFWHDRRERPTHYAGRTREDEADRRALWEACEALTA